MDAPRPCAACAGRSCRRPMVRPVARSRRDRAGHGAARAGIAGAGQRDRAACHRAERRTRGATSPSCPTAPSGRRMRPSRKAVSCWRAMAPCGMLSCNVVQGSSGAPVMRMTEDGPEIVAVISATATDRTGRDVSMAVALEGPFAGCSTRWSVAPGPVRCQAGSNGCRRRGMMAAARVSARGSSGPDALTCRGVLKPRFSLPT
jgi:hypothetical protein